MRVKLLIIALFFFTVMTGCGGSSSNLPADNQQKLEEVPEIEDTPIIE